MPRTCSICRSPRRHEIEADLQAGLSYRDVARRYNISKDAASRHRASHVSLHTTPALTTVTKIVALLDKAETDTTWNATLLRVREAHRYVEELIMLLNLTLPSSRQT
jgi:transposase